MTSVIDELLEDMRTREAAYRDKVSAMIAPSDVRCGTEKANRLARHIAAVEEMQDGYDEMLHQHGWEERTADGDQTDD